MMFVWPPARSERALPPISYTPISSATRNNPLLAVIALIPLLCGTVTAQLPAGAGHGIPRVPPAPPSARPPAYPTAHAAVLVTLSRTRYAIRADPRTGAPIMPTDVTASAALGGTPADAPQPTFQWRACLDWDFAPFPTHHSISNRTLLQRSPLHVDFGREVRGGTLRVYARTVVDGQPVFGMARAEVLAENPPRSVVLRAFPPSRSGLLASKIGMAESGLRQFASGTGGAGLPVVSRTGDVGVMQVNAPSGAIASADEIWDWRANVRRGLAILQAKRHVTVLASRYGGSGVLRGGERYSAESRLALACVELGRSLIGLPWLPAPQAPSLSDRPGSGLLPGEPDPDCLNITQIEREQIRRYNGGTEYCFDWAIAQSGLDIVRAQWQPDSTRGGVRERAGDPNYVQHVLLARSGFTIAKAAPAAKRTPRRRKHGRH